MCYEISLKINFVIITKSVLRLRDRGLLVFSFEVFINYGVSVLVNGQMEVAAGVANIIPSHELHLYS